MGNRSVTSESRLKITDLLKPHSKALALGLLAAVGEGVANLLEPWPLKIVFDNVLKARPVHGWLNRFVVSTVGDDPLAILKFAVLAVILIALFDALCSHAEKYLTTSVSQWVMHDLRRTLYSPFTGCLLPTTTRSRPATSSAASPAISTQSRVLLLRDCSVAC